MYVLILICGTEEPDHLPSEFHIGPFSDPSYARLFARDNFRERATFRIEEIVDPVCAVNHLNK